MTLSFKMMHRPCCEQFHVGTTFFLLTRTTFLGQSIILSNGVIISWKRHYCWVFKMYVFIVFRAQFSPIILERRQKALWLISPKLGNPHQNYLDWWIALWERGNICIFDFVVNCPFNANWSWKILWNSYIWGKKGHYNSIIFISIGQQCLHFKTDAIVTRKHLPFWSVLEQHNKTRSQQPPGDVWYTALISDMFLLLLILVVLRLLVTLIKLLLESVLEYKI